MDSTKINEIIEDLRQCLDAERFEHTLGVADMCVILAESYGCDKDKAYLAGLLHDCAKCLPKEELLSLIKENADVLHIEECEYINPKTFHAPAGAIIASRRYQISDAEILNSIRWHTLGKVDMSLLEKIIYLADKIEHRTRPESCRKPIEDALVENGLDAAILQTYKATIKSLVDRDLAICCQTIDVYNNLLRQFK